MCAIARDLAALFAESADSYDRSGTFPAAFYTTLHQSGYLAFVVPTEYGGRGASLADMVRCQELLAMGCGSTAMAVDMTVHVIGRIAETRSYPAAIYESICRDIVANGALVNAVASEKDLGSPSRGGLPATTAAWDGRQWQINGHKLFVSMAPILRSLITAVALPVTDEMPHGGIANAIVRGDAPGLTILDTWGDALALRSSGSGDVVYRDVPVDDAWLIERKSAAATSPAEPPTGMAWFALTLAGVYLGIGQAAVTASRTTPTPVSRRHSANPSGHCRTSNTASAKPAYRSRQPGRCYMTSPIPGASSPIPACTSARASLPPNTRRPMLRWSPPIRRSGLQAVLGLPVICRSNASSAMCGLELPIPPTTMRHSNSSGGRNCNATRNECNRSSRPLLFRVNNQCYNDAAKLHCIGAWHDISRHRRQRTHHRPVDTGHQ